ncbi:sensor domain-containing diguanylate cyclase [Deinococcus sp. QL22]|uniref:GGDEF domain-containing protein n=1 Tax=Deinococcus sp. QL22 TaxID=2939437 RepID=UPI002017B971|nr:sensor domain-containing diguanylate cyclase [Deinococcus sp. QL22]UQN06842.1 diguanylate cyclase [Deinococcus sp. QL22]
MTNRRERRQQLRLTALPEQVAENGTSWSQQLRRRVYLAALAFGIPVLLMVWVLQLGHPSPDQYILYAHPPLLIMCIWAAGWVLRGRPLRVAEQVVFTFNVVAVLAQSLMTVLTPGASVLDLSSSTYWMLVALSILAFLIFDTRRGALLTAVSYLLCVAFPWAALVSRGEGSLSANTSLLRVQLTCGAILMLLSGLAWYRAQFLQERSERLTLYHLAHTDPLTGLPNRRALYPAVETLLVATSQGMAGSVILLDLDHFKRINDTYGHNVGDDVLMYTAALLRSALRDSDTVGRWGGEEFLVTLPDTDRVGATRVAERVRCLMQNTLQPPAGQVTASLGVATCEPGDDLRVLTARADAAMYEAKQKGRNRVVVAQRSALAEPGTLSPPTLTLWGEEVG